MSSSRERGFVLSARIQDENSENSKTKPFVRINLDKYAFFKFTSPLFKQPLKY